MKNFLLSEHPNFGEVKCSIEGQQYTMAQVKGNGVCLHVVDETSGLERDQVCFSKNDLKALFCLLCTEK
jgi:hypothetical protein